MNTEPNTSEPPAPTTGNGSNPWKIFGIAVIVLALTAGVAALGYLLRASEDNGDSAVVETSSTATLPPTTAARLPPATDPPATTAAGPTPESQLATVAQARTAADDSYASLFSNPALCTALADGLQASDETIRFIEAVGDQIRSQSDILRLVERRPADDNVRRAASEAIENNRTYQTNILRLRSDVLIGTLGGVGSSFSC
jgi:hypothetical protein